MSNPALEFENEMKIVMIIDYNTPTPLCTTYESRTSDPGMIFSNLLKDSIRINFE